MYAGEISCFAFLLGLTMQNRRRARFTRNVDLGRKSMSARPYTIPDSAPVWVKNVLKGSPSRHSVQALIWLSVFAAAAGVYAARWHRSALVALVFLYYAGLGWAALRWTDRNGIFPEKGPSPTTKPASPSRAGSP